MSKSKTIVVTGATRGLGRALVGEFVALGHVVVGCGRSKEHCALLREEYPPPNSFTALDVSDDAAVSAWAHSVLEDHDTPDLVINNAALMNDPAPLWEVSAEEFGTLMDVNVDGTVHVIRAFVPAMLDAGRGIIANLSSGWGRSTSPEVAPYCASKFAVEGLTKALAQELPAPLCAVAVSPGVVNTDMLEQAWGAGAADHPGAESWGPGAAEFFLSLDRSHNGRSLTV